MRGKFITIYGINNVGKTTHSKCLVQRLKAAGKKAFYIKYPVYSLAPTGPYLNKILRLRGKQKMSEEELQLWFVLNRFHFEPKLLAMLQKGITVIAEDYVGTGIAWGMAKGVSRLTLENMNKFLVQPDVAIFMDGQRSLKSKEKAHIHETDDALAARCQRIFRQLAKRYMWKIIKVPKDRNVTAGRIWKAAIG